MQFPSFNLWQWTFAVIAAICIGISKTGFGGVSMFSILLMAHLMPARESTGVILPLLICGDVYAISTFRRHANWSYVGRLLPMALVGIVLGYICLGLVSDAVFRPIIGATVLGLSALQFARSLRPEAVEKFPHTWWFAAVTGIGAGVTTMMANAAGPIIALYLLAVGLPKMEFVGTAAWFFFVLNLCKVPLSMKLGLLGSSALSLDLLLAPAVILGAIGGKMLLRHAPQKVFERIVLVLTAAAAIRMIFS